MIHLASERVDRGHGQTSTAYFCESDVTVPSGSAAERSHYPLSDGDRRLEVGSVFKVTGRPTKVTLALSFATNLGVLTHENGAWSCTSADGGNLLIAEGQLDAGPLHNISLAANFATGEYERVVVNGAIIRPTVVPPLPREPAAVDFDDLLKRYWADEESLTSDEKNMARGCANDRELEELMQANTRAEWRRANEPKPTSARLTPSPHSPVFTFSLSVDGPPKSGVSLARFYGAGL